MHVVTTGGPMVKGDSATRRKAYVRIVNTTDIPKTKSKTEDQSITQTMTSKGLPTPKNDVVVIMAIIENAKVHRLLVDMRSSCDVLFMLTFEQLEIDARKLEDSTGPLLDFTGNLPPWSEPSTFQ